MASSTDKAKKRKRRPTPKQRVLKKRPDAYAAQGPNDLWAVFATRFGGPYRYISHPRRSATQAWREAAKWIGA